MKTSEKTSYYYCELSTNRLKGFLKQLNGHTYWATGHSASEWSPVDCSYDVKKNSRVYLTCDVVTGRNLGFIPVTNKSKNPTDKLFHKITQAEFIRWIRDKKNPVKS